MINKRDKQGEILIDHRNSPGISEEFARANNLSGPIVGAGKVFESGLKNCVHCGADVIMHPQRTREREWCWKCDAYICDGCGLLLKLGGECQPVQKTLETIFSRYQRSF